MSKLKDGISLSNVRKIFKKLKFNETCNDKYIYFSQNKFIIVLKKTHGNKYLDDRNMNVIRFHFEMRGYSNKIIKNFDTLKHIHYIKEKTY